MLEEILQGCWLPNVLSRPKKPGLSSLVIGQSELSALLLRGELCWILATTLEIEVGKVNVATATPIVYHQKARLSSTPRSA